MMPYTPTPIIIYDDPQAVPPEVADLNTASWAKANQNFEDISAAMASVFGANVGLLEDLPEAGNQGAFYFATDAPATLWFDDGTNWKAALTFGTAVGTACQGNDARLSDQRSPTAHATGHITGAGDEIDGDKLNIDWNPTNSTPATVTDYSTDTDDLTSHLKGIDTAIGGKQASLGYTAENTANKNAASGYCGLDAGGKVATAQLPDTVLGALQYKGVHDCSTAAYPVGPETGDYYVVSVQGTIATILYRAGDWLVYDGAAWGKIDATVVSSVAGKTGAVTLTTADVTDSSDKRYCTDAQKTVIGNTSGTNSGNETTTTLGTLVSGATAKDTPVDADMLLLMDSAASNVIKKLSWSYIKSVLKTYFDGLYPATTDARLSDARTPTNHNLIDTTGHPVTGLTTGHVLKASGATAYGFSALSASDVGLSNVTNAAQLTAAQLAAASGVASLDASSKVVQDPASSVVTGTAGAAISQYDLLYCDVNDAGKYKLASNSAEATYDVKGIALAAIELGASGVIRVGSGTVSNAAWAWTPGATLYCGVDGAIIEDIDDIEWIKPIGHADTATKIVFAPQLGYNRDDPVVEVNGDTLEINYNPTGYAAPTVKQLAEHLAKISEKLAEFEGRIAAFE